MTSNAGDRSTLLNIPNAVTLSRLLGIPALFWVLGDPTVDQRWVAVVIFTIIAATDWLDGYLARRLNQVTDLGKILDPLVDKLMVVAPLLILVELEQLPAWGVFLIIARELFIAGWRVRQTTVSGANLLGKAKTVSQIVAIALLIAPLPSAWMTLSLIAFWISVALTLLSGLLYVFPVNTADAQA
ncbi:MAG: CDP-diacylglycerol--glycerol-3-phosphate 3-phosphatidyltransferase [Elainellaceae cyanobacterium]